MNKKVVYLKIEYDGDCTTSTQIMQAIMEFEDVREIENIDYRIEQLRGSLRQFLQDLGVVEEKQA